MKQFFILLTLFSLVACVGAQNWQPFALGESHQFRSDTVTFADRRVRVDSITGNAADSVWHFNRLWHNVNINTVHLDWPNFCKKRMRIHPNGLYQFLDPGNVAVHAQAGVGATWLLDSAQNLSGTVLGIYADSVLGEPDSIKVILVGGTDSLLLSRDHGLVSWPGILGGGEQQLSGLQSRSLGDTLPGLRDLFRHKTGDVYYWRSDEYNSSGWPVLFEYHLQVKMTVDSVVNDSNGMHIHYQVLGRWYQPPFNTAGIAFTSGGVWNIEDNAAGLLGRFNQEVVPLDQSMLSLTVGCSWCTHGMITGTGPNNYGVPFYSMMKANKVNDSLEMVIGSYPETQGMAWGLSSFPSAVGYGIAQEIWLKEGLGLLKEFWQDFEVSSGYEMVGYVIDGDTSGTLWTDQELLAIEEGARALPIRLWPNPGVGAVNLEVMDVSEAEVRIGDLMGRELLFAPYGGQVMRLDVSGLPAGIYTVTVIAGEAQATKRLVIRE